MENLEFRRRWLFLATIGFVFAFLLGPEAPAGVYRFVDKDGVVHFTNVPTDSRYEPLGDKAGKKKKQRYKRTKKGKASFRHRLMTQYDDYIREASGRFNIPENLIRAVMAVESNFNHKAVSRAGAQGLMQLMPATADQMGVLDSFDPRQNILGGTRYLRTLANAFDGDLVLTLAAYNAGQTAVDRHMDIPPYAETQRYVRRVLKLYYYYKDQIGSTPAGKPGPSDGGKAK